MAAYVFDSSAVVKRYVRETGTAWVLSLTDPGAEHAIYVARITGVEVVSALTRQTRSGALDPAAAATALTQFRHDFAHQYYTVDLTPTLIAQAMALAETHAVRGYDAVQCTAAVIRPHRAPGARHAPADVGVRRRRTQHGGCSGRAASRGSQRAPVRVAGVLSGRSDGWRGVCRLHAVTL